MRVVDSDSQNSDLKLINFSATNKSTLEYGEFPALHWTWSSVYVTSCSHAGEWLLYGCWVQLACYVLLQICDCRFAVEKRFGNWSGHNEWLKSIYWPDWALFRRRERTVVGFVAVGVGVRGGVVEMGVWRQLDNELVERHVLADARFTFVCSLHLLVAVRLFDHLERERHRSRMFWMFTSFCVMACRFLVVLTRL